MRRYILSDGTPYTIGESFPYAIPTSVITLEHVISIAATCPRLEGRVEVEIGHDAYKGLGPVQGDALKFTLVPMPHRSDFIGVEWIEREVLTPEWASAAFEDATLWDAGGQIAYIRFRRALEPTSETSCLTDRELLEDIHAMLKQLTQQ